jgi:hypothetical protein
MIETIIATDLLVHDLTTLVDIVRLETGERERK